ncbi:MAG: aldehyde dehydrogenase family protein [Planctomycetes bacterium]|nr:aldehyde dehydrogenase family protein [Planctomycetota bacterium]
MASVESIHALPRFPWRDRLRWMARFESAVAHHALELSQEISDEIGKPQGEAYVTELLPLIAAIRWHRRHAQKLLRGRRVGGRPWWMIGRSLREFRAPLGRVLIIATWNYPAGLLGIQLLQAIAAGNTVVVKPSERSPRSQSMLLRIAQACGLPEGALQVVGCSPQAGREALESGGFDHVMFTGGTETGRAVAAHCAETLTSSTLELSGRDSAFVLDGADVGRAARSIWNALTMNAGQTCMAPRRVFVERKCYRAFLDALAPLAAGARPLRLIDAHAADRCEKLVRQAVAMGGRSLSAVIDAAKGCQLRPLVVVDCPVDSPLAEGDHFGPVLAILPVENFPEAVKLHRGGRHHLTASIYTAEAHAMCRDESLMSILGVGVVTFNESVMPTGHPALAIGGRGSSGWGASRGREGLMQLTRAVAATSTAGWAPSAKTPNAKTLKSLAKIVGWISGAAPVSFAGMAEAPAPERPAKKRELQLQESDDRSSESP